MWSFQSFIQKKQFEKKTKDEEKEKKIKDLKKKIEAEEQEKDDVDSPEVRCLVLISSSFLPCFLYSFFFFRRKKLPPLKTQPLLQPLRQLRIQKRRVKK